MAREKHPQTIEDRAQVMHELERGITVSEVLQALGSVGLRYRDFSLLSGRTKSAVYAWQRSASLPPAEVAEHIDDTRYVALNLLQTNDDLPFNVLTFWFRSRSFGLDGQRPLEALAEGKFDKVLAVGQNETAASSPLS
jgi:hypothetical protein